MKPERKPALEVEVRDLRPGDVESLCRLLVAAFQREYTEQGLDVWGFRPHYRLVAWTNRILTPLGLDFFQVVVAVAGGQVVGTLASFPADRGAWYQGFGAVDPTIRRRGVYKRLIRRTLEKVAARGGRWGGGEIRHDNLGALRPYRDVFGSEVLPLRRIFLVGADRSALPVPPVPPPVRELHDREFERLPAADVLRRDFRGGFLIEREATRGLVGCLLRWLLPPITVRLYRIGEADEEPVVVRVRTHWPAGILALDAVHLPAGVDRERSRAAIATLVARLFSAARPGRPPVRIYVGEDDELLASVCAELGFAHWCDVYPIRTDVAAALARTDSNGELTVSAKGVTAAEGGTA